MPLDPTLTYPFTEKPAEGELFEVAEGIYWLRFPLPFALNHVHAWLLRDNWNGVDGWCLVDCGIGGNRMRELWENIIATKLDDKPITRLIATHFHPDHVGSAHSLDQLQQPLLVMNETEWLYTRMYALDTTRLRDRAVADYLKLAALPDDLTQRLLNRKSHYADAVPTPPLRMQPIVAGDIITISGTAWQVMIGSGHSPAMVSLYCPSRKLYISSDQVLPGITPNVSVWAYNPYENPLGDFIKSLEESAALPLDTLCLPSHGMPFYGITTRCHNLIAHHHERLDLLMESASSPATIYDLMLKLFPQALDEHQTGFALGETVAHVNYLVEKGDLHRHTASTCEWQLQIT